MDILLLAKESMSGFVMANCREYLPAPDFFNQLDWRREESFCGLRICRLCFLPFACATVYNPNKACKQ